MIITSVSSRRQRNTAVCCIVRISHPRKLHASAYIVCSILVAERVVSKPLILLRSRSLCWLNKSELEVVNSEPTSSHWSLEALHTNADFAISYFNCFCFVWNTSFRVCINQLGNSLLAYSSINTTCWLEFCVVTTFTVQRIVHFCTNGVSSIWKTGDFLPIIEGSLCAIRSITCPIFEIATMIWTITTLWLIECPTILSSTIEVFNGTCHISACELLRLHCFTIKRTKF